jgi:hypothetical protein
MNRPHEYSMSEFRLLERRPKRNISESSFLPRIFIIIVVVGACMLQATSEKGGAFETIDSNDIV